MANLDEIQRTLGRIEGALSAIQEDMSEGKSRMDNHGERIRRVENRQTATWMAGGVIAAGLAFTEKIKHLWGG